MNGANGGTLGTAPAAGSTINTTGANLIVAMTSWYHASPEGTLTDSKSNTWTQLTNSSGGSNSNARIYYCYNPTVGSGHSFSYNGANTYPALCIQAWSGAVASPFDQQNGALATASTIQAGSITPTANNELIVAGIAAGTGFTAPTINSGLTVSDTGLGGGSAFGNSMAYLVQSTAAAINPTWTVGSSTDLNAVIASFKGSAAAPPASAGQWFSLSGL